MQDPQKSQNLKKVAVIGAGPAGLSAALRLAEAGVSVDLYEAQAEVGGLCRSLQLWGHTVDLGPHRFFSQSEKVNRLWFRMVGEDYSWVPRQTRIFHQGRFFEYPLQFLNTVRNLGFWQSWACLGSYLLQKLSRRPDQRHFEGWIQSHFGRRLYELFFKTYSEKLWGVPCDQIDSDFAYRKIRRLSLGRVLKNFFFQQKRQSEFFVYPHRGTGSVYVTMAQKFAQSGGQLILNTRVDRMKILENSISISSRQGEVIYDEVISTMPLPYLVKMLNPCEEVRAASQSLRFRNTVLVYLLIEGQSHFADNWVYVHSPEVDFGRVTHFDNWGPKVNNSANESVICVEYWCDGQEPLWISQDQALLDNAVEGLKVCGLIPQLKVKAGAVYRVPKSYPIFTLDYKEHLEKLHQFLKGFPRIHSIGRNGSFLYNNQDHSVLMGLEIAENILSQNSQAVSVPLQKYEEDAPLPRFAVLEEV